MSGRLGRVGWSVAAIGVLTIGMTVVPPGPAAYANPNPNCSGSHNHQMGRFHVDSTDNRVGGIRTPIQFRTDSYLCVHSPTVASSSQWIGVGDPNPPSSGDPDSGQIRQAGWLHAPISDPGPYCQFYAINTGFPHEYSCGYINDSWEYWEIVAISPATGSNYFSIRDCGDDDLNPYSDCPEIARDTTPDVSISEASSEEDLDNDDTTCPAQERTAGSSADRVNFGTDAHAIHQKNEASSLANAEPPWVR